MEWYLVRQAALQSICKWFSCQSSLLPFESSGSHCVKKIFKSQKKKKKLQLLFHWRKKGRNSKIEIGRKREDERRNEERKKRMNGRKCSMSEGNKRKKWKTFSIFLLRQRERGMKKGQRKGRIENGRIKERLREKGRKMRGKKCLACEWKKKDQKQPSH